MRIVVEVDYETYTIQEPDPNDTWDNGSYGLNATIDGVFIEKPGMHYKSYVTIDPVEPIESGDDVMVVWAIYQTGDTFGSHEEFIVLDVCKDENRARLLASELEKIQQYTYEYNGYRIPWTGYFESLSQMYLTRAVVE